MSLDVDDLEVAPERPAPTRRARRRAKRLRRRLAAGVALAALLATTVAVIARRPDDGAGGGVGRRAVKPASPVTYLVMTVRQGDLSRQADTLTLFSFGGGAQPYVLMIPASTLTEIPGYGFDSVGRSLSFGRLPLATITVENVLGVRVDHVAVLDDAAFARIVDRLGGITVQVPQNLFRPDGTGRLVPAFGAGTQKLSGAQAVSYLTYQADDETEVSRLAREQQIWEAMFARVSSSGANAVARAVGSLRTGVDGDVSAAGLGRYLGSFGALQASTRTYDVLPVTPVGAGDPQGAFRIDQTELDTQVARYLRASLANPRGRPTLQILNGNGAPEAGVNVALRLIPAGFELVDSGNARSFDFATTKIVVYLDDAPTLAIAQHVRQLLGVGEIEVSRLPQTSIDVTVVIGKDFKAA